MSEIKADVNLNNINVTSNISTGINTTSTGIGGPRGTGIASMEQVATATEDDGVNVWRATLTNGDSYNLQVRNGSKGEVGATGNGIANAVLNDDYTLTLNFTDGSSVTTESIRGEQGPRGETGEQGPQGIQGVQGPAGKNFSIAKTYISVVAMKADKDNVNEGDFVMITSDVEDPDNASLYVRTDSDLADDAFSFVTDLSGAQGIKGDKGEQGIQGEQGVPGPKGESGGVWGEISGNMSSQTDLTEALDTKLDMAGDATITEEGTDFTINNTIAGGGLSKVEVKGQTFQQTYSGKNRIFPQDIESTTLNGVTFSVSDGVITLNGTSTAVTRISDALYNLTDMAGKPAFSVIPISGSWTGGNIGVRFYAGSTQTFAQQMKSDGSFYHSNTLTDNQIQSITSGQVFFGSQNVFSNFKCRVMLTKSEVIETDYEPYTGGTASPNPDYPQEVQTVTGEQTVEIRGSKNLFDFEQFYNNRASFTVNNGNMWNHACCVKHCWIYMFGCCTTWCHFY